MAQHKKDEVKESIDSAALEVFSRKGYLNTKIADISRLSGVSVGNIYRYYKGKDDLFYSLIPQEFYDGLKKKLTQKITCWDGKSNSAKHLLLSRELTDFMTTHKRPLVILFSGSTGTRYAEIRCEIVSLMTEVFFSRYEARLNFEFTEKRNIIRLLYEKHVEAILSVFHSPISPEELSRSIRLLNDYHVRGITGFISPESETEET